MYSDIMFILLQCQRIYLFIIVYIYKLCKIVKEYFLS